MDGVTVGASSFSARPLCTERQRMFLFVSRIPGYAGGKLAEDAQALAQLAENMPVHHVRSFLLEKAGLQDDILPPSGVAQELDTSAYHKAFAKGLAAAIKKKRLPEGIEPVQKRPSLTDPPLKAKTPWLRANADLYFTILQHKAQTLEIKDPVFLLASRCGTCIAHDAWPPRLSNWPVTTNSSDPNTI